MRKSFLAIMALMMTTVAALPAEQSARQKSDNAAPKLLPLKGAAPDNSCAAYGAGFVKVEGTGTCVKIGGAVSIGAGASTGSR